MAQRQRPCKPKKQLYEGKPGAMLVCPECHQTMPGIRYEYGIGLLTLPTHYNPLWMKNRFRNHFVRHSASRWNDPKYVTR